MMRKMFGVLLTATALLGCPEQSKDTKPAPSASSKPANPPAASGAAAPSAGGW